MLSKLYGLGAVFLVLLLLFGLLSACTSPTEEPLLPAESPTFPLKVIDQAGRAVRIEKNPEKIISLAPSNTEILYALGLEGRLFGVTEYCDYPEAAKDKPKIGGFSTVDIERVVEIQPDLILAGNIHKDKVIPELDRLGLATLAINPQTISDVMKAINLIGMAADRKERASQLVAEMQGRINAITSKTASLTESQRPRVLYVLWHEPLMTAGSGTRIDELIIKAGGINIASDLDGDYPTMSLEAVIMANPQIIVAGSGHGTGENLPFDFAMTDSRLEDVAARQNNPR